MTCCVDDAAFVLLPSALMNPGCGMASGTNNLPCSCKQATAIVSNVVRISIFAAKRPHLL